MKRRYLFPLLTILIPATGLILFLTAAQLLRYRPEPVEQTEVLSSGDTEDFRVITVGDTLEILNWNIGYAGLDAGTDFVMDGGTRGRPDNREQVEENLLGITDFLKQIDADFYLFQEVDRPSRRTYQIDQSDILRLLKPTYDARFAMNFKVFFIPFPVNQPISQVRSGLLNLSRFEIVNSQRHQLPGDYSWPVRLFMLRRCIIISEFKTDIPGRSLYLANIHLSAYDDGGMRKQELEYLKNWMTGLYKDGHYVVLGGDWNSLFPEVGLNDFTPWTTTDENLFWIQEIPENWTPSQWKWGWDPGIPTCRTLDKPYRINENFRTIIDGYLVSPNVRIESVLTHDEGFTYSDHNPVSLKFRLDK